MSKPISSGRLTACRVVSGSCTTVAEIRHVAVLQGDHSDALRDTLYSEPMGLDSSCSGPSLVARPAGVDALGGHRSGRYRESSLRLPKPPARRRAKASRPAQPRRNGPQTDPLRSAPWPPGWKSARGTPWRTSAPAKAGTRGCSPTSSARRAPCTPRRSRRVWSSRYERKPTSRSWRKSTRSWDAMTVPTSPATASTWLTCGTYTTTFPNRGKCCAKFGGP